VRHLIDRLVGLCVVGLVIVFWVAWWSQDTSHWNEGMFFWTGVLNGISYFASAMLAWECCAKLASRHV
jgi:hypothetical protein